MSDVINVSESVKAVRRENYKLVGLHNSLNCEERKL
jgi:hypothetical protein